MEKAETPNAQPLEQRIMTPVLTLDHAVSNRKVTLVGTMHIGLPEYYADLQKTIDAEEAAGAKVYYEEVIPVDRKAVAPIPRKYKKRMDRIYAIAQHSEDMTKGTNLIHQKQGITPRDTWENRDATNLELAQRINGRALFALSLLTNIRARMYRQQKPEQRLETMIAEFAAMNRQAETQPPKLLELLAPTLLDYRNEIFLTSYDQLQVEEPDRDVVLLAGMGHLKGLREGFEDRKFELAKQEMRLAIDIGTIALQES